jgi:hypothetical protein
MLQITISDQINSSVHSEIIAGAVECARALNLENSNMIFNNYSSCEEHDLAKRAMWFLYSIEVPHSLQWGKSSVGINPLSTLVTPQPF